MLGVIISTIIVPVVAVWTWQFLNWVWLKPRKLERLFRKQGMKGNPYRFFYGDSKDTARMYKEAFISKPIAINDDAVPRVMPNIYQAVQQFGNFCFTWAGPRPRVFIMDPDIARDVIGKHQEYLKPFPANNYQQRMLATGLACLEGEAWSKSRSRVSPVFMMEKLKSMVATIQLCGEGTLMKELRNLTTKGGGKCTVDVFPHTKFMTSEVLARLMFNCPYTDEVRGVFLKLDELANLASVHSRIWSIPGEKYLPTKTNWKAAAIEKHVRFSFNSMIDERLKNRKAQEPRDKNVDHKDLLDVFMDELYNGDLSNKDNQRIRDEVIAELKIFFFAGFETTANLLTWCLVMLSFHQDCQDRAREEILQALGNNDEITSNDVAKLKYVTMIINEALRLYSPSLEVTRLVDEDTTIKGYKIPSGTLLTFPILMYHRSVEYWGKDAREFKPDRFADGVMKATNGNAAFMPFGWGPRICVGMNLSLLEVKVMLVMLLRDFSFEPSPTYTHAPSAPSTLQPQFGAPLVLKKL